MRAARRDEPMWQRVPSTPLLLLAAAATILICWSAAFAITEAQRLPFFDLALEYLLHRDLPLLDYLLAPNNEHVPLLARPFYLADWYLAGAQGRLLVAAILSILVIQAWLLVQAACSATGARVSWWRRTQWTAIAAAPLFWLAGWANLVFPFQLHMHLSHCLDLAALAWLLRLVRVPALAARWSATLIWLLLLLGAVLSFGSGLAAAVTLTLLAWLLPLARSVRLRLTAAAALAIASYAVLGLAAVTVTGPGSPLENLARPLDLVAFVHGGLVAYGFWLRDLLPVWTFHAVAGGLYALLAWDLAGVCRRRRGPPSVEALGLGLMVMVAAMYLLVALARLDLPGSEPHAPRYLVWPPLFYLGAAIYVGSRLLRSRISAAPWLVSAALLACLALMLRSQNGFIDQEQRWIEQVRLAEAATINALLPDSVLGAFSPVAPGRRMHIERLIVGLRAHPGSLPNWPGYPVIGEPLTSLPRLPAIACSASITAGIPQSDTLELRGQASVEGATLSAVAVVDASDRVRAIGWLLHRWAGDGLWAAFAPVAPGDDAYRAIPLLMRDGQLGVCAGYSM